MSDLTDQQIETLADHWPWEYDQVAEALHAAEGEGWPLDDTVRALDVLAEEFGEGSDPANVIRAAIAYKRREQAPRHLGPS